MQWISQEIRCANRTMGIIKTGNDEDFYHLWEPSLKLEDYRGSGISLCQIVNRHVLYISIIEHSEPYKNKSFN